MKEWNEKQAREKPAQLRVIEPRLPYDEDMEAVVLATLIDHPQRLDSVIDTLRPGDFYVLRHRALYEVMLSYYYKHGRGADFLMLSNLLDENEDVKPSDMAGMLRLKDELFSFDFAAGVRLIRGCSAQRAHIFASQKLAEIGYSVADADEARAAVEKLLYELTMQATSPSDFESLDEVLTPCMDGIEYAGQHRGQMTGIPTGFRDLDVMTDGLQRSDFILLAARPSEGKTSLGINIGYNAAKRGQMVAVFSLEMSKKQLGYRLLSQASGIPSNQIRSGLLDDDEMERIIQARDALGELPLHIDDVAGSPVSSIRSKLRRLSARHHRKPDLVIVDYLGLMTPENDTKTARENRNQEISEISRGLKGIAREMNVPLLVLAQMNRAIEGRREKKPQLSDLRDSGSLEQDADIVLFICHDASQPGFTQIIVAKQRNGPTGEFTLAFHRALTRFDNVDFTIKPAWNDGDEEDD